MNEPLSELNINVDNDYSHICLHISCLKAQSLYRFRFVLHISDWNKIPKFHRESRKSQWYKPLQDQNFCLVTRFYLLVFPIVLSPSFQNKDIQSSLLFVKILLVVEVG